MIKDNLNPDFEKSFIVNYYFEKHQYIKFEVVDGNNVGGTLDLIGTCETTIGAIVGSKQQTFMGDLLAGTTTSRGKIIVRADAVKESNMDVSLRISARNLPNSVSCMCGSNNIFFEIHRGSLNGG